MRSFLAPLIFVLMAYAACTPPDEVRLQNYIEPAADGFYAQVPVCYYPGRIFLGDSYSDFRHQTSELRETASTETDCGIVKREFITARRDTTLNCSFKNGRLIYLESKTILSQDCASAAEACELLGENYPCLGELGIWMDNQQTDTFRRAEDAFAEEFKLVRNGKNFGSLVYRIGYFDDYDCDTNNHS
ncbi:MAG: hypothetical protein KDC13_06270 [Bacteroidetes bacterium]|nr:hypothetical protein [Bacteroidota bacterium]